MSLPLLRFIFNCMYTCGGWVGTCLDMGSSTGQGQPTAITFTLMSQFVDPQWLYYDEDITLELVNLQSKSLSE